ncbi:hypothetical protein [Actinomadura coerulea]|uniref:hypothetical protein n=1 Tax=Actinomadura coerulea TaxID=46159 RepID=UPI00341F5448
MSLHPQKLSYAALDELTAEVLPRRTLLSTLPAGTGGGHTEVFYACQATKSDGTSGLLGTGLLAEAPTSTVTCVPAVVVHDKP